MAVVFAELDKTGEINWRLIDLPFLQGYETAPEELPLRAGLDSVPVRSDETELISSDRL